MNLGFPNPYGDGGSADQSLPGEAAINTFNQWLQDTYPAQYAKLRAKRPELFSYRNQATGFYGLGEQPVQSVAPPNQWLNLAKSAVEGVFAYKTQKKLIELNMERAAKGLPPVSAQDIAPTVKVEHGVALPGKPILWVTLGGLALVLFFLRKAR